MSMVKSRKKMLESYFCSNHNASNPNPIVVLAYMKLHFSYKENSFGCKDNYLPTSIHILYSNFKIGNHGGLPIYMPLVLKVCEIIDLGEDAKPPKKKLKKSYESSQNCQDICDA